MPEAPVTRTVMVVFCAAAATISALSAITLLLPGTALDGMWSAKPDEHHALLEHRAPAGLGFATLSFPLGAAAVGWWRRRTWGWWLATVIIGFNLLSDLVRWVLDPGWEATVPVVLAGAVLAWLCSSRVRPRRGDPVRSGRRWMP